MKAAQFARTSDSIHDQCSINESKTRFGSKIGSILGLTNGSKSGREKNTKSTKTSTPVTKDTTAGTYVVQKSDSLYNCSPQLKTTISTEPTVSICKTPCPTSISNNGSAMGSVKSLPTSTRRINATAPVIHRNNPKVITPDKQSDCGVTSNLQEEDGGQHYEASNKEIVNIRHFGQFMKATIETVLVSQRSVLVKVNNHIFKLLYSVVVILIS